MAHSPASEITEPTKARSVAKSAGKSIESPDKEEKGRRSGRRAAAKMTKDPSKSGPAEVQPESEGMVSGPELKKQELLEKVVSRTDVKKKFAKPVIDAVLEVLGETLAEGRELNLPGFGRLKLNRARGKDTSNARVIVAKIRQGKPRSEGNAAARAARVAAKDEVAADEE